MLKFAGVSSVTNKETPSVCVCRSGVFSVSGDVFASLFQSARCQSCDSSWKERLKERLPLLWMSALTAGGIQSTHHHSFIDSSGSASIPSSLIQKLRTAILIALRTVEVFNGLYCSRRIRTCHPAESLLVQTLHAVYSLKIPLKYRRSSQ